MTRFGTGVVVSAILSRLRMLDYQESTAVPAIASLLDKDSV
jgi:hypothetical protein